MPNLTKTTLSASLIDICTNDYVPDHCNGDNECLIGVSVGPDLFTASDILKAAVDEADMNEKIPADITTLDLAAAMGQACQDAARAVGNLLASGVWDDHDEDSDDSDGYVQSDSYAWIRLTWEAAEV